MKKKIAIINASIHYVVYDRVFVSTQGKTNQTRYNGCKFLTRIS